MEVQDIKPKKRPTKIEEMTKEQIRQAILKKREYNARAQNIVESLLEKCVTESYFLQSLPDINQTHFEDVIEERSIIHLCGYPLCQKSLSDKDIPKQKYRISMKTNKVYDITARKSFCSNECYKAAMHVKKQMLTSPLWFREYEEIPTFHLLTSDTTGSLGQEVDVALIQKISLKTKSFTSINDFANASLHEMSNDNVSQDAQEKSEDISNIKNKSDSTKSTQTEPCKPIENILHVTFNTEAKDPQDTYNTNETSQTTKVTEETKKKPTNTKLQKKKHISNPLNIVGDVVEKSQKDIDPILANKPKKITSKEPPKPAKKLTQKKQPSVAAVTILVEKCLAEWFTLDTMLFLFGDEKVREMLAGKGECVKEYLNNYANSISYNSHNYDQYQALCRKLNMLELEDRRYDSATLQRQTKPLPDYSMLQEESKRMKLKVKAFFAGDTEIPEPVENEDKTMKQENTIVTRLPLVDKNAQNALRRRIVCEHLNKSLPDLLRSLGLLTLSISSDVRLLVNTFKLKANNIMFKPIQWTLITIVVIKLLSLRDKKLEYLLEKPTAYEHMQLLLLSFKQDGGYLDRLISWLIDVDRVLDTNDTQLTIE